MMSTKPSKSSGDFPRPNGLVGGLSCVELFGKRQKRKMDLLSGKIRAWGDLLDLLGWCVVYDLGDAKGTWIGKSAQTWLSQQNDKSWQEKMGSSEWLYRLKEHVPAGQIKVSAPGLLVWAAEASGSACAADVAALSLTRREREILAWVCEGKTSAEIAVILGRSIRTIEKHLENIYKKLGARDRASLIMKNAASTSIEPNRD